ncbi:MAG: methylmalonyl Co-A mutase-associated GTPase MeaB [Candidatus Aminicenantes bacterium]|nr:methylmalonyl Co-A mutase-associated GTPase MeaB [Candidatus Aminicenantes bacterium]NIM78001.1 methylmalonyl Co-A mutase-associated GTPase MeaB [Candidatus Aminicenantes bacterium]NIN17323.1 methylmalonyl Co-A mutase-associated GTPase MeaB [Candidatus Aminicenantes bacterium]NIN41215.1 methylmalonyl Co-A mutase-associated GTPase MeaB [Candidatus Aminicenantes bacterium]NIN83989.1 methylmalonyl Co-A mutase-associated GTPase MeaB [Candidatus Aminicenantes bacterium]
MSDEQSYLPDWAPKDGGDAFAVRVKKGIETHSFVKKTPASTPKKRSELTVDEYVNGVLKNDKTVLARAITLVESNAPEHYEKAREVLKRLLPHSGKSLRVGITGVPGGGKSMLIETLGCQLIDQGHKIAVLTVDPSSTITKGSILGDKTRMEKLSRLQGCFIRPSPSGGTLGGVTRKTRETILICEAAGYDVVLIETIGVGQSEIAVRSMVDFFLLVMIAGAGDELQGIKKGVMELADALMVNKADGRNKAHALRAKNEYAMALKYLAPATKGWETKAYTCSALTGEGIREIWENIKTFERITKQTGVFKERRQRQSIDWVFSMIEDYLKENFYSNPSVQKELPIIKEKLLKGDLLPTTAAENLLKAYYLSEK